MRTDPRYVAARRVLLDALQALQAHSDALVIAGAQAVYLHTGDGDLAVAPFTTDADVAVDPGRLAPDPLIEAAMTDAGFQLAIYGGHVEPGIWTTEVAVAGEQLLVPVDLIVPEAAASGGGRRGARLALHGRRAARRATGLEAALVNHAPMTIAALDPADARSLTANVAGPPALLVAKAHKIHDRVESGRVEPPGRQGRRRCAAADADHQPGNGRDHPDRACRPPDGRKRLRRGARLSRGAVRPPRATWSRDGHQSDAPRAPSREGGGDLHRLHGGAAAGR